MPKVLAALLAVIAVSACATGYNTRGVVAVPLGRDLYRIEANLNQYSNQSMVQDYLLLRAADTAIEAGAEGFVIVSERNTTRQRTFVTGGSSQTTATVQSFGNYAYGSATTTHSAPQIIERTMPGGSIMIELVRNPMATARYFSAVDIRTSIGPRVKLD